MHNIAVLKLLVQQSFGLTPLTVNVVFIHDIEDKAYVVKVKPGKNPGRGALSFGIISK